MFSFLSCFPGNHLWAHIFEDILPQSSESHSGWFTWNYQGELSNLTKMQFFFCLYFLICANICICNPCSFHPNICLGLMLNASCFCFRFLLETSQKTLRLKCKRWSYPSSPIQTLLSSQYPLPILTWPPLMLWNWHVRLIQMVRHFEYNPFFSLWGFLLKCASCITNLNFKLHNVQDCLRVFLVEIFLSSPNAPDSHFESLRSCWELAGLIRRFWVLQVVERCWWSVNWTWWMLELMRWRSSWGESYL